MTKKKHELSSKIRTSTSLNNTSGIFRVSLHKQKKCSKGFTWKYYYHVGKKRKCISSVDLLKLKEKVLAKGLEWIILDEEKAKASMEL